MKKKAPASEILWQGKFVIENWEDEDQSSTEEGEDPIMKIEEIKLAEEQFDLMHIFDTIVPSDFYGMVEHIHLNGVDGGIYGYYGIKEEDLISPAKTTFSNTDSTAQSQSTLPEEIKFDEPIIVDPVSMPQPDPQVSSQPVKTANGWTKTKKKKIGPNDPCPCGSQRKLKKCCKVAP